MSDERESITEPMTETVALVVAAGRGQRFGGPLPKQYAELDDRPVLGHTLARLADHPRIDHRQIGAATHKGHTQSAEHLMGFQLTTILEKQIMLKNIITGLFIAAATLPSVALCADDAVIADPKHYTVEFENDKVRIIRIKYGPHEKSVMHTHGPHVSVLLSAGKVRFTLPDGSTVEDTQKLGVAQWSDGEEHLPENLSDDPLEVIIVELKE